MRITRVAALAAATGLVMSGCSGGASGGDGTTIRISANSVKGGISPRQDVNSEMLGGDPLLNFIATKVLPITDVRPGLAAYPQVSTAMQKATGDVVAGDSVDKAIKSYQQNLTQAVGGAGNVITG